MELRPKINIISQAEINKLFLWVPLLWDIFLNNYTCVVIVLGYFITASGILLLGYLLGTFFLGLLLEPCSCSGILFRFQWSGVTVAMVNGVHELRRLFKITVFEF